MFQSYRTVLGGGGGVVTILNILKESLQFIYIKVKDLKYPSHKCHIKDRLI
jgi:hypothetical protein